MRGRLRDKYSFWASFCRNKLVLTWILTGFPLMFLAGPPAARWLANHGSTRTHAEFVRSSIQELVETGTAKPVSFQPHCVLPLGVAERPGTGKLHLILDARYLNEHLHIPAFKYETLTGLHAVLQQNDYMFTVDLKSGYHHVDMHPDSETYLGFWWEGQFYVFTQLPFGLAPACWAFTKVTRELLNLWRSEGHRVSGYLDDSIHAHQSASTLRVLQDRILGDFARAGFIISIEKCHLTPLQTVHYLGAVVDTVHGTLTVPSAKREALLKMVSGALETPRCELRKVASIVGTLVSMSHSFGQLSILMTRRLVQWQARMTAEGHPLHHHMPLDDEAKGELVFWKGCFDKYDGHQPIWSPPYMHTVRVYTDAAGASDWSFGGWGGWAAGAARQASGRWAMDTRGLSSGYLEMLSIYHVLRSINKDNFLNGQRVLLHTDSTVAMSVLRKGGSMVPNIQSVCFDLLWYCLEHHIKLVATWIPRIMNVLSDSLSKRQELCDWQLNPLVFLSLWERWGPFSVDLFASDTNYQFLPYFSYMYSPHALAVNAFTQFWPATAWCNPPFAVIGRALMHAALCKTRVAMLVPFWPGASWWHQLVENECVFNSNVWGCVPLQSSDLTGYYTANWHKPVQAFHPTITAQTIDAYVARSVSMHQQQQQQEEEVEGEAFNATAAAAAVRKAISVGLQLPHVLGDGHGTVAALCARNRVPVLGASGKIAALFLTHLRLEAASRNIGPQLVERGSAAVSAF